MGLEGLTVVFLAGAESLSVGCSELVCFICCLVGAGFAATVVAFLVCTGSVDSECFSSVFEAGRAELFTAVFVAGLALFLDTVLAVELLAVFAGELIVFRIGGGWAGTASWVSSSTS